MADPQVVANVGDRVAKVRDAQRRALAELDGKWLGGDAAKTGAKSIRGLGPRIDAWAETGERAAATGASPGPTGWPGWVKAGDILVDGIEEIAGMALAEPMAIFEETVTKAPETSIAAVEKVAKRTAKAAASVTKVTSEAAGAALGAVTRPLIVPALIVVAGLLAWSLRDAFRKAA